MSRQSEFKYKIKNVMLRLHSGFNAAARSARHMLLHNRMQSLLTMLGFFISAFLISAIFVGAHSSMISAAYEKSPFGADVLNINVTDGAALFDADFLNEELKNEKSVGDIIPLQKIDDVDMYGNSQKNFKYSVFATNEMFFDNAAVKIISGKAFSASDVSLRRAAAVISREAAEALFADSDPVGQELKMNNQIYNISGVFEGIRGYNPGCLVVVPNKSARILLGASDVNTYVVTDASDEETAKAAVSGVIDKRMAESKKFTADPDAKPAYSMEYIGTKKNKTYMIGIIMYIIMLLLSGAGLLMFIMFPSKAAEDSVDSLRKIRCIKSFAINAFICCAITVLGGLIGAAIGVSAGILYCFISGIPLALDIGLLWISLVVLLISVIFSMIIALLAQALC